MHVIHTRAEGEHADGQTRECVHPSIHASAAHSAACSGAESAEVGRDIAEALEEAEEAATLGTGGGGGIAAPRLETLSLRGCVRVDDHGVVALVSSCTVLRALDLSQCDVTDAAAVATAITYSRILYNSI